MKTTTIAVINGHTIQVSNDEQQLVPIKPVCQALGVDFSGQLQTIKSHPIFGPTVGLCPIVAVDGKEREMSAQKDITHSRHYSTEI